MMKKPNALTIVKAILLDKTVEFLIEGQQVFAGTANETIYFT